MDLLYIVCIRVRGDGGQASCLSRHLSYLSVTKTLSKHTNNILNIKQKYTQNDVDDDDDDEDGESQAEMGREGRVLLLLLPKQTKDKSTRKFKLTKIMHEHYQKETARE